MTLPRTPVSAKVVVAAAAAVLVVRVRAVVVAVAEAEAVADAVAVAVDPAAVAEAAAADDSRPSRRTNVRQGPSAMTGFLFVRKFCAAGGGACHPASFLWTPAMAQ